MMKKFEVIVFLTFFGSLSAQINLSSNLTGCFALNGNGYEAINNLHGVLNNVLPTQDRFSIANKALGFAGTANSFVELPNSSLLKPNTLSFSAWIKPISGSSQVGYIVYTKSASGQTHEAYSLSLETVLNVKKLRVKKNNNIASVFVESTSALAINNWCFVCFTIDQNYLKLYLNGVLEDSLHATMSFNYDATKKIYLGATNEPNNNSAFKGTIDDVRFYSRVLSHAEINQLYLTHPSCITSANAPVASFTTSALCVNTPVNFLDLSSNFPDTWNWSIQGAIATNPLDANPVYTFSAIGNYTATLISSNANGSDTTSLSFYIHPNPTVLAHSSKTIVCRGESQNLTASGAFSYLWNTSQTGSNAVVAPYTTTTYTVLGTDTNGCKNSGTIRLVVPSDCWVSLDKNLSENNSILIYPNPSNGKFTIDFAENDLTFFTIHNLSGTQIRKGELNFSEKKVIDIENEVPGIYFIKVKNITLKILKQ